MKMKMATVSALLILGVSAGSTLADEVKPAAQPVPAPPKATVVKPTGEAPAWMKSAKQPVASGTAEAKEAGSDLIQISGKVLEKYDVNSYTYFLIEKDGKQTWVAVPTTEAKIGDELSFRPGIQMVKQKSYVLNKDFDVIIYSVGTVGSKADDKFLQKISDKGGAKPATPKNDAAAPAPVAPPAVETIPISGKVLEVAEGGGYSYFLLEKDGKKMWVATPPLKVKVGETVTFQPGMEMKDFASKSLNKTFDTIIFSDGPALSDKEKQDASRQAHQAAKATGNAQTTGTDGKPLDVKVAKATAPNGYSVAELYAKSADLNGKEVVVQGKVVKVSKKIMGKNWIHLQDGSGDPGAGSNNLVVTSQELAEKGETVTAKGILAKDKDFGGGYQYAVIVEDGTFVKK